MNVPAKRSATVLRTALAIHAVLTLAAGVVLVVVPAAIPGTVGITVEPAAYLLCYLLAATELGVGALSWSARGITDARALRAILVSFVVMHAATGILEIYAFTRGLDAAIWANVALRVVVVAVFGYFAARPPRPS
jgi:hypothetical protein